MDKREQFGHLLIKALSKARELRAFVLDSVSRARAAELVKSAKKTYDKMQVLNRTSRSNGKGLDKAVLDSALDELIETFKGVNKRLDELLAKGPDRKVRPFRLYGPRSAVTPDPRTASSARGGWNRRPRATILFLASSNEAGVTIRDAAPGGRNARQSRHWPERCETRAR